MLFSLHVQVEHVKAERNVLAEVHSPYIVKLYYSFQVRACCSAEPWNINAMRRSCVSLMRCCCTCSAVYIILLPVKP